MSAGPMERLCILRVCSRDIGMYGGPLPPYVDNMGHKSG